MIFEAKNYAHDSYERGETVEHLVEGNRGDFEQWPREVAEKFSENHSPGYEIGYKFMYDAEADEVVVTEVYINGQIFTLEDQQEPA